MKTRVARIIAVLTFLLLAPTLVLAKGVVLNFTDVDIATMVKFISDLTGKNFIMDDRVKGKISIFSPAKLSNEEAYNVFTSVLELKGFTVVPAGKVWKIVPTAAAKQYGMKVLGEGERGVVNEGYVARVLTLESIAPQDAVNFLQPLVAKDGYISAFGPANMLLVVDSALNIQKIVGILKQIDTPQQREGAELIFLKNASAESTANVVRDWLGGKEKAAATTKQGQAAAAPSAAPMVVPDSRLNALVVFGSDQDKADVRKLVSLIDVVPPTTTSKVNVYYLENAEAVEVAKVLEGVVKASAIAAAPAPGAQAGNPAQQSPFEGGRINITPDKATNSLVVMASPSDYQNLLQVIQKLDKRRRQVFVQAVIAEISLDKLKEVGVQLGITGSAANHTVAGAGAVDPFGFLSAGDATQSAVVEILKAAVAGVGGTNFQIAGTLRALANSGAVNVLSTPTVMTSDNKEAEIFVGENVPFITGTNLSSTGLSQQSIERKDTGITLKLTPQISEGEYVKLDIYQEISAVKDALNKGAAADITTTKRSAKTSVVVKDKDTVVIGGLIQDNDSETINKVPVLGDIPVVGWLFKTKSTQRKKTNLMILLTPRIIRGTAEMMEVSGAQQQRFNDAIRMDQPFNLGRELQQKP